MNLTALWVDLELLSPTNQEGTRLKPWPSLLGQVVGRVIGDIDHDCIGLGSMAPGAVQCNDCIHKGCRLELCPQPFLLSFFLVTL